MFPLRRYQSLVARVPPIEEAALSILFSIFALLTLLFNMAVMLGWSWRITLRNAIIAVPVFLALAFCLCLGAEQEVDGGSRKVCRNHQALWLLSGTLVGGILVILHTDYRLCWAAFAILLGAGRWFWGSASQNSATSTPPAPLSIRIGLLTLVIAAALLAFCGSTPNHDDGLYLNIAVSTITNPDLPVFGFDDVHGGHLPYLFPPFRSTIYELLSAFGADATGTKVYGWYYIVLPMIFAPAAVLLWWRWARYFVPTHALTAVALILLITLVWGPEKDQTRSFGSFSFFHFFHGKSVLFTFGLPLVLLQAIDFAHRPSARRWILLALAQTAAVGFSSTALATAPAASATGLMAVFFSGQATLQTVVIGATASVHPVLAVSALLLSGASGLGDVGNFLPPLAIFGNELRTILALSALVLLSYQPGPMANSAIVSNLALVVLLIPLNPLVIAMVRDHAAQNMSWRMAYVAPMPIIIGLVVASVLSFWKAGRRGVMWTAVTLVGLGVFILGGRWTFDPHSRFSAPGAYNQPPAVKIACGIVGRLARGSDTILLAADPIATWIETCYVRPRLVLGGHTTRLVYPVFHEKEDYEWRLLLYALVNGPIDTTGTCHSTLGGCMSPAPNGEVRRQMLDRFQGELQKHNVTAVVLRTSGFSSVEAALVQTGFVSSPVNEEFALWQIP